MPSFSICLQSYTGESGPRLRPHRDFHTEASASRLWWCCLVLRFLPGGRTSGIVWWRSVHCGFLSGSVIGIRISLNIAKMVWQIWIIVSIHTYKINGVNERQHALWLATEPNKRAFYNSIIIIIIISDLSTWTILLSFILQYTLGMRQKYTKLNQECSVNMFNKSSKKVRKSRIIS